MDYNLLEESWLPVLMNDGRYEKLDVLEALRQAATIRQLAPSNPMDRFAVFRFLLALCYWCADRTKVPFPQAGNELPQEWFDYLREHRDCFNLLGEGKRFYQERCSNNKKITSLIHELPTGNNAEFLRHYDDGMPGLCSACCALGLIRLPVFTTKGGRGLRPGINGAPPVYSAFWGESLLETLQLNCHKHENIGKPVWEEAQKMDDIEGDIPLLFGLTGVPRRVWLDEPSQNSTKQRCIYCGQEFETLHRDCDFSETTIRETSRWTDPHVCYIVPEKGERKPVRARVPTKSSQFHFVTETNEQVPLPSLQQTARIYCVGVSTKDAGFTNVWERTLVIPVEPDSSVQLNMDDKLEGKLAQKIDLILNEDKDKKPYKRTPKHAPARTAFIAQLARPHVEEQVARHMGEMLAGNGMYTWEDAANEYAPLMRAAAESLAPGNTVADERKRRLVEQIRPVVNQEGKNDG